MTLLSDQLIFQIYEVAIKLRLGRSRVVLLSGIGDDFSGELVAEMSPNAQMLADLNAMNNVGELASGLIPLQSWLTAAYVLTKVHKEAEIFQRGLRAIVAAKASAAASTGSGETEVAPGTGEPLRILFFGAKPRDREELALEQESRAIRERLLGTPLRFEVVTELGAQPAHLQACLLRVKPAIVHFSVHGSESGAILFEDDAGRAVPLSPSAIADLFRILGRGIRCVVLNACFSEELAKAVVRHVDYVVGMSEGIHDHSAIAFASAFYLALGHGKTVREAFELGCLELRTLEHKGADIPRLLVRRRLTSVCVVHAREDEIDCRVLQTHLESLRREGAIQGWEHVTLGELGQRPAEADVVMFLLSEHLLAPKHGDALRGTLDRARSASAKTMPILVRPCAWRDSSFAPEGDVTLKGKPISTWASRDDAWLEVEGAIRAECAPR